MAVLAPPEAKKVGDAEKSQHSAKRQEAGTFISTVDNDAYQAAAFRYYKGWGYPNVKPVQSIEQVLTDVGKFAKNTIDTVRIVGHGVENPPDLQFHISLREKNQRAADELSDDFMIAKELDYATTSYHVEHLVNLVNGLLHQNFDIVLAAANALHAAAAGDAALQAAMVAANFGDNTDIAKSALKSRPIGLLIVSSVLLAGMQQLQADAKTLKQMKGIFGRLQSAALKEWKAQAAKDGTPESVIDAFDKASRPHLAAIQVEYTNDDPSVWFQQDNEREIGERTKMVEGTSEFFKLLTKARQALRKGAHIEIRGCHVGRDRRYLTGFQNLFGTPGKLPKVSAPDLYQYYSDLDTEIHSPEDISDIPDLQTQSEAFARLAGGDVTKRGEETRGTAKLQDLATRYGESLAKLEAINWFRSSDEIGAKTIIWLRCPKLRLVGTTLDAVLFSARLAPKHGVVSKEKYKELEAKVRAANPGVFDKDGKVIGNPDHFFVNTEKERDAFGVSELSHSIDLRAAIPRDVLLAAVNRGDPMIHLKNFAWPVLVAPTAADAAAGLARVAHRDIGELAPHKRGISLGALQTEIESGKLGRTDDEKSRIPNRIHTNFLSWAYPKPEDHIFINDPRYQKHIIEEEGDS